MGAARKVGPGRRAYMDKDVLIRAWQAPEDIRFVVAAIRAWRSTPKYCNLAAGGMMSG